MNGLTFEERAAVLAEARSWCGTRWHHQGRIKGAGVDCGMFLLEVYERVGVIPHIVPPPYPADWNLHRSEEKYLSFIERFCSPVEHPQPADIVAFKWGRCISHAAIVVKWPTIIHSYIANGVCMDDAMANADLAKRFAGAYAYDRSKSQTV